MVSVVVSVVVAAGCVLGVMEGGYVCAGGMGSVCGRLCMYERCRRCRSTSNNPPVTAGAEQFGHSQWNFILRMKV